MKSKIKYTILLLLLFGQYSCNNWMNLLPPENLIRNEFWKSKEDVQTVLMGAYHSLASLNGSMFEYGEMRGDMVTYDKNLSNNARNVIESNIYDDNSYCNWSNFYKVIDYANEVIKNAPLVRKVDDTYTDFQMKWDMSEAYWIRSLTYFYLVRIFKDVPLVLDPTESDNSKFYIPKTDGDEILKQMMSDLEENRQYATTDGYPTLQEIKGRATKAAYDALIADIALWLYDYNTCIQYANNVLSDKNYQMVPNVRWFDIFYPGNSLEGIFELQFDSQLREDNALYGLTQHLSYNYDPSEKAIEMFAHEFGATELYRGEGISIKKYAENDWVIWKYIGSAPDGTSVRSSAEQASANWIIYRVADVVLMKAEALSQLGQFSQALDLINKIRERADVPDLTLPDSKNAYEDAILNERAHELAFEGKRWFDLLRMGRRDNYARKSDLVAIIVQNVPSTQKRILSTKLNNPLGWYMPIAKSELQRNPALVQNPYYKF